jgi:hypothetical protein
MTKMLRIWALVASLFAILNISGGALASTTIASRSSPCEGLSDAAGDCDDGAEEAAAIETRRRHSDLM